MRSLLPLVWLGTSLSGQTFIVDAAGGAGSSFTDIPAAVAVVPDGAVLLVRAGSYSPFQIRAKGLSVLADAGAEVVNPNPQGGGVEVYDTLPGQPVIVRGLQLRGTIVAALMRANSCRGRVLFEDLVVAPPSLGVLTASQSDDVLVRRCGPFSGGFFAISLGYSDATLIDCSASNGAFPVMNLTAGRTEVVDCALEGGGAIGGAAVAMLAGASLTLFGGTTVTALPLGSPAPAAIAGGGPFGGGSVVRDTASAINGATIGVTVTAQAQAYTAATGGTIGAPVSAELTVPTGALGALGLGGLGANVELPGLAGVLWLDPSHVVIAAAGVGGTAITVSAVVPGAPALQGASFGWQGVAFEPGRGFFFGNVVPFAP